MLFFRQTLLAVCLIVCCAFASAQPQALDDLLADIFEDSGPTLPHNIIENDQAGDGFSILANTVDLDTSTPGVYDGSIQTIGGIFTYDLTNSVVFQPDANYEGPVLVDYTVETDEPQTLTASISLTVLAVNDPPVITANILPQVVLEDESSEALSFTVTDVETPANDLLVTGNAGGSTIIVSGISFGGSGTDRNVTITPELNQNGGPVTITIQAQDTDEGTDEATFEVNVTAVNDAPTITSPGFQNIDEDASMESFSFTVSDIDNDLSSLLLTGSSSDPGVISNSQVSFDGTAEDRTVIVTPEANQNGPVTITLQVTDPAMASAQTTFDVNVEPVNDAPTFVTIPADQDINENSTTGPLAVAVDDIDSDPTTLSLSAVSTNQTIIPNANIDIQGASPNPTIEVTSTIESGGSADIQMTVSDGLASATESFTVSVLNVDAPPTIEAISDQAIDEDTSLDDLPFTIDDPDGLTGITFSATSNNQPLIPDGQIAIGGTLAAPTISLSPVANAFGTATITVVVDDGTSTASTTFDVEVINVNDAPTLVPPAAQTIPQGGSTGALNFTVADIDSPLGSLTVAASSSNGTIIPNGNISIGGGMGATRTVTVTPPANQSGGPVIISLEITDGDESSISTFAVTITPNAAPTIAAPSAQNITEGASTGALNFTVGDTDDALTDLTVTASSSNQTIIPDANILIAGGLGATRTVTVTPPANAYGGPVTITLVVDDGDATASAAFTVNIAAVNDAPTLTGPANQTFNEGGSTGALNFTVGDIDDDLGDLTVTASSSNVTIIPNANIVIGGGLGATRTVTVTPPINQFGGPVTITLEVSDGDLSATTTFTVTINNVNDAPTMTGPGPQTIDENTPTGALNFTVDDIDNPIASLTVTGTSSNQTLIPNANIAIGGGTGATRTVTVTPAANQSGGPVTITLTVSDGTLTGTATFTVTINNVNEAPTITGPGPQTIAEDGSSGALNFTVADPDSAIPSLTVTASSSNQTIIPDGNIVIGGGTGATRTVAVSPAANQSGGPVTITLTVSDGDLTGTATFAVTVNAVNDAPTIAAPGPQTVDENTPTSALNFMVADIDSPIPSLTVTGTSSNQTLIPNANIAIGGGIGATRTVIVTPAANQSGGPVTITLTVSDGTLTGTATFTVTINDVNDPPTITGPGPQTVPEDGTSGALNFTVADIDSPIPSLTVTATSSNQTIIPDGNIVIGGGTGATRTVTVSPAANQSGGPVTITLTVSDGDLTGIAAFAVTVNAVNDAPTITGPGAQTVQEDGSTNALNFTVGDIDSPIASLTVTATSGNQTIIPNGNIVIGGGTGATRTVTVTPAANQTGGPVTITLSVSDGSATATATFDVTVTDENDPPTISTITNKTTNEDVQTAAIPFTVGDAETDPADLTVTASSDNTDLVINTAIVVAGSGPNRTVQITPVANQSGTVTITLTVSDGDLTTSTSFQLTVNSVNDAPTISAITDKDINEDTASPAWPFTIGDVETPGTLTVTASSGNTDLISNANIVLGGSGANRTIQVTPSANQSGTSVITVNVMDGTNTTSTTFTVTVNSVNDVPTISAIADQEVAEDNPTAALAFTVGDTETAPGSLTLSATSDNTVLVPVAAVGFGGSGAARTVTVTPAANQNGVANITITVNDGTADASTTFQLTVTAVNDAPVITAQTPVATDEEQPVDIEFAHLVVNDPDNNYPDGFTMTILGNPGYTFTDNTVTPNANVTGNITVRVQVSDGALSSNIFNLQVAVTPVNDPPTITAQNPSPLTVNEDGSISVLISHLTIVDPDNASGFTLSLTDGANYSVSGNVVTPDPNYNGTLSVPVTVSDGTTSSAPFPLQIQVNPINDVPQITGQVSITIAEVQPVAIELSQLTVFDPDNDYPDDFTIAILSGPNYSITGNTVVPVPNFSGTLLVRVFVNDGTANSAIYNLQISVNTTNDPPVISGQTPLNTDEGVAIAIGLDNLTVEDPDNDYPDDFTLTILPGANYTFSGNVVTPNADYEGVLSVLVKVNDGEVDSAPYNLQISINGINNAPVIANQLPVTTAEDQPVTLRLADLVVTDPDSPFPGIFTLTVSPGTNYTVSGHTVTPASNFSGTLSVPVTVNDGALTSAPYNVEVTVTPVNDAPVISGQNSLTTFEDQAIVLKLADLQVTDVDNTYPTGFSLTVQPGSGATYTVSGATVTPALNFNGTLTVSVLVSDGAANSNVFPVEITVSPVNDPPTLNVINDITIQEDPTEVTTVSLAGITSGGGEASQVVTVTATHDKPEWFETFNVQYSGGSTGSLTIKPLPDKFGTATITVRVQDNGPTGAPNVNFIQRTFSFIVEPVNDPPVFLTNPVTLIEVGTEYLYLIEAEDLEEEAITFGAPLVPDWLSLSQNANGKATLSGTPPPGTTGEISVIIQVKDPAGTPVTNQEFKINVNARPVISSFPIATDEEVSFAFSSEFASNFVDADGNSLTEIEITVTPEKGTLFLGQTAVTQNQKILLADLQTLTYVPMTDSTGTDSFSWNASDGIFYSNKEEEVIITIRAINDPPEIIALELPANDTLKYELGSERPILLTRIFDARDVDGDDIVGAEISFSDPRQYYPMEDQLIFRDTLGIVGNFNDILGILTLSGRASVANYVAAIRSIRYNLVVAPVNSLANVGDNRLISIKLSDGVFGGTKERLVGLVNTFLELDIATAFTPTGANPFWNIYSPNGLEQYKDALIKVYNKRGTLVYEAKGFGVPWNGDGFEGALPADSYFYTIDLKYDKKKYKGVVTILR